VWFGIYPVGQTDTQRDRATDPHTDPQTDPHGILIRIAYFATALAGPMGELTTEKDDVTGV